MNLIFNLLTWLEKTDPGEYAQVTAEGDWWTYETGSLLAKRCKEFASTK